MERWRDRGTYLVVQTDDRGAFSVKRIEPGTYRVRKGYICASDAAGRSNFHMTGPSATLVVPRGRADIHADVDLPE